MEDHLDF